MPITLEDFVDSFPSLDGFGPTRATLHSYAQAINTVVRVHARSRPHWWHTSLKVVDDGLASDPLPLPSGTSAILKMNFQTHQIELDDGAGGLTVFPMDAGWSGTQMGDALIGAVGDMGLRGEYERRRFEGSAPGQYDTDMVSRYFTAIQSASHVFEAHMATLHGTVSAVQLWPHNFDLSAEWYGTKQIPYDEDGTTNMLPVQLNLGFYPGEDNEDSYFYSNPWPFDGDQLLDQPLPEGAKWHTEGWQGTELPYELLVNRSDAEERLRVFAQAVYAIALPTLSD